MDADPDASWAGIVVGGGWPGRRLALLSTRRKKRFLNVNLKLHYAEPTDHWDLDDFRLCYMSLETGLTFSERPE